MKVQQSIEKKLEVAFNPIFLDVKNESHKHNVPPGSESHFKVVIVSEAFEQKNLVQQHQMVHQALADDLSGPIHALSIQSKTPLQWENSTKTIRATPQCLGGSKVN